MGGDRKLGGVYNCCDKTALRGDLLMIYSLFDFRFVALALSINLIAIMLETGLNVSVPAQQEVIFKPGKLAITLTGLKQDLKP